jgi:hypothetical protein
MDGGKYTQVYGADAGGCLRRDRRSNRTPTGAVTFATPPLRGDYQHLYRCLLWLHGTNTVHMR